MPSTAMRARPARRTTSQASKAQPISVASSVSEVGWASAANQASRVSIRAGGRFVRAPLLIAAGFHVDEIEHDEPAHVAQAKLAADFLGRFQVDFEDGRFLVLAAFVAARVYVDGDERFSFIDHDVAAAPEVDLAAERALKLARNIEAVKNRLVLGVEPHFVR